MSRRNRNRSKKSVLQKLRVVPLAAAFALLLLAGCASNGQSQQVNAPASALQSSFERVGDLTPEPGASLVVWESREARPFVEAIIREFTALYGVEVKLEELGTMDQVGKLELDGPIGLAADVITTSQDHLGKAASAGLILPNDLFAEETRAEHEKVAVDAATYNDQLYGYPIKVMTYAMFYNKDLIAEPPATLEEVITFAETFNNPADNTYAFMFDVPFFYFSYPFIGSTGGYIFGENGTNPDDIGLNSQGAVAGMEIYAGLRERVLPVTAGDIASDIKTTLFSEGKVAMNVTGSWFIENFRQAGINFGVAPIPAIGGQPSVSLSQVNSWYVNAYTKYPNAAKLFARFASTEAAQLLNYELTGAVPTQTAAAQAEMIKQDELTSTFYTQFSQSHAAPSIPEVANIWVPMDAAMVEIWEGADVQATLDRAVASIRDAMALTREGGQAGGGQTEQAEPPPF